MKGNTVVIPKFLTDIGKDYDSIWNNNATCKSSICKNIGEADYYDQRDLLRVVREAFGAYACYPSTIKSTIVSIMLSLTQKGYQLVRGKYLNDNKVTQLLDRIKCKELTISV